MDGLYGATSMLSQSGVGPPSLYTPTRQRKYLTPAERAQFIAAAKDCPRRDVGALCLMLAYTGCRISEALALTASGIDAASGTVAIFSLKKRGRMLMREIPAPPVLFEALEHGAHLAQLAPQDRLWDFCRSRAWQLVKAVMAQGGVPVGVHATPKGLRHGFGIHAIRCGIPITLVQRWLGHASVETTAIYLQAMGTEEREIAARMW